MGTLALALTWKIGRSRLGFSLAAVRENEDAAETAGVDALVTKLRAMALSSFLTALGGTFYAQYFAYIDPTITFGPSVSIGALLPAIVGGAGTVLGPVWARSCSRPSPSSRAMRCAGARAPTSCSTAPSSSS